MAAGGQSVQGVLWALRRSLHSVFALHDCDLVAFRLVNGVSLWRAWLDFVWGGVFVSSVFFSRARDGGVFISRFRGWAESWVR